jgi:uncharacterized protein (TIGR02145 family)
MKRLFLLSCLYSTALFAQIPMVQIDTLIWSVANLNVTKFRNGDEIRNARTREEWIECLQNGIPAYCDYRNDTANGRKYGHIYNWFAISDRRGLAPNGTRVSNNRDWRDLYLTANAGVFNWANMGLVGLRLRSSQGWEYAQPGENQFNFNILPGGYRNDNGEFVGLGTETALWVRDTLTYNWVTLGNAHSSPYGLIHSQKSDVIFQNDGRRTGCYVRIVLGFEYATAPPSKKTTTIPQEDEVESEGSDAKEPKKKKKKS